MSDSISNYLEVPFINISKRNNINKYLTTNKKKFKNFINDFIVKENDKSSSDISMLIYNNHIKSKVIN